MDIELRILSDICKILNLLHERNYVPCISCMVDIVAPERIIEFNVRIELRLLGVCTLIALDFERQELKEITSTTTIPWVETLP